MKPIRMIKPLRSLRALIQQDSEYADAFALMGSTFEKTGKYEQAIKAFEQALELDPKTVHYLTQRVLLHYFAGEYELAESRPSGSPETYRHQPYHPVQSGFGFK